MSQPAGARCLQSEQPARRPSDEPPLGPRDEQAHQHTDRTRQTGDRARSSEPRLERLYRGLAQLVDHGDAVDAPNRAVRGA